MYALGRSDILSHLPNEVHRFPSAGVADSAHGSTVSDIPANLRLHIITWFFSLQAPRGLCNLSVTLSRCAGQIRPYLVLIRSSLSRTGSVPNHRNTAVAPAWTQSMGRPVSRYEPMIPRFSSPAHMRAEAVFMMPP